MPRVPSERVQQREAEGIYCFCDQCYREGRGVLRPRTTWRRHNPDRGPGPSQKRARPCQPDAAAAAVADPAVVADAVAVEDVDPDADAGVDAAVDDVDSQELNPLVPLVQVPMPMHMAIDDVEPVMAPDSRAVERARQQDVHLRDTPWSTAPAPSTCHTQLLHRRHGVGANKFASPGEQLIGSDFSVADVAQLALAYQRQHNVSQVFVAR
jgi:hypothetical protein